MAKAGVFRKVARGAAWYAVFLVIAVIAVGVEVDRQARYDPELGVLVPKAFRMDALATLARSAFSRNEPGQGEALARELVEGRPVPAESLSIYANGLLSNGKSDVAESVLQVAADRGWRDRFVQHVVIASALQNGQPAVAAQRVIGLWRLGERADWLKDVTRATLGERDGLAAFTAALSDGQNDFGENFLIWSAVALPPPSVDRLARALAKSRARFNCIWFSRESDRLVREGKYYAAMAIWSAFCAASRPLMVDDLRFVETEGNPGPFDWRYPENSGVDTQISENIARATLNYSNTEPIYHVIARRYIILSSARYVLTADETNSVFPARWGIACISSEGFTRELKLELDTTGARSFVVPADCKVQEVSIAARSSSGEIGSMTLRLIKK